MNRTKLIVAAVVVLAIVGAAAFVMFGQDDSDDAPEAGPAVTGTTGPKAETIDEELVAASGFGDPSDVDIPAATDPDATVAYLTGEAAPLLEFRGLVQPLLSGQPLTAAKCADLAATLDKGPKPETLVATASGTPDGPTRDLLVTLVTATPPALQSCEGDSSARAELAWQVAVLDGRLGELGVTEGD